MAGAAKDHPKTNSMTIKKAKEDLAAFRGEQRALRKKIDALRKFLRDRGVDPDPPAVDLTERNKAIYSRYLDGLTWSEIAGEFKLSPERVKQICKRVDHMNEKRVRREQEGGMVCAPQDEISQSRKILHKIEVLPAPSK